MLSLPASGPAYLSLISLTLLQLRFNYGVSYILSPRGLSHMGLLPTLKKVLHKCPSRLRRGRLRRIEEQFGDILSPWTFHQYCAIGPIPWHLGPAPGDLVGYGLDAPNNPKRTPPNTMWRLHFGPIPGHLAGHWFFHPKMPRTRPSPTHHFGHAPGHLARHALFHHKMPKKSTN